MAREPEGCLLAILRLVFGGGGRRGEIPLPYRRREFLLSRAEASFFGVLTQIVGPEYLIFAKIRVADLLLVSGAGGERQGAMNRIQSKHVDFVLCTRNGVRPVLAIELDDASHDAPKRVARDDFLRKAMAAAGLPLLQVRAAKSYDTSALRARIDAAIAGTDPSTP